MFPYDIRLSSYIMSRAMVGSRVLHPDIANQIKPYIQDAFHSLVVPRPGWFLYAFFRPSVSSQMRPRLRTYSDSIDSTVQSPVFSISSEASIVLLLAG